MAVPPIQENAHDVIVIGAGASGLAACAELARAGRSVLLLEARERLGGRCWTRFEPGLGVPIELGAEFIHGEPEVTLSLLRQAGTVPIDSSGGQRMMVQNGRLAAVDGFAEAKKAVRNTASLLKKDLSFEQYLASQKQLTQKTRTLARMMVEGFDAADPKRVSARSIAEEWGSGMSLGASQPRPLGGYGPLLASLLRDPADLRLGAVVRAVRWKRGSVTVEAEFQGRRLRATARSAVVTLPLGVLQAGAVEFTPRLPKEEALKRLVSGPVIKTAFRFRSAFWEKSARDAAFFHAPQAPFPTFWNQLPLRAPMLVGWAGGPKAAQMRSLATPAVIARALESLKTIFGRDVSGEIQSVRVQDWQRDPYAFGAYSYVGVGGEGARERLAAPLEDTLFFAGEATDPEEAGTVAGALQSGARAARELLAT